MEHGHSWFSFVPGFLELQTWLNAQGFKGVLFQKPVVLQHVAAAALVTLIVLLVSIKARAELHKAQGSIIPDDKISVRNIFEVVFEALYGQMKNIIGEDCRRYFPLIGTLALFIFFSNVLGLVPGFLPPTDNWNTTITCGIVVFLYYNFHGLRAHGFGHIAHMANPAGEWWGWILAPLMFPIELVSHVSRPFSLGVRLASNMIGDHAVLAAFIGLVPFLVPLPFMALGLMVSLVQTVVFVLLSMIYIGLAVAESHEEEHHGEGAPAAHPA